uniref:Uncharacterized protein n=1 Tax=viral metagenome TaxID=1070528 RepID=A0A2V0RM50_9ZZZZ
MNGNIRNEEQSQNLCDGMIVANTFRSAQLRSFVSAIVGMKCVRMHPLELEPRAKFFKIEESRNLACHILNVGPSPVRDYFIALTYEFDMFGKAHPGMYCLSVRCRNKMVAHMFNPVTTDQFVKYVRNEIGMVGEFDFVIRQGSAYSVRYGQVKPHLPPRVPILFYAQSAVLSDMYMIYMMMRYNYYQYPIAGQPLEGIEDVV